MRGLLADDSGVGQQPRQRLGQDRLAFGVGDGDGIVRRLLRDFAERQALVMRQYRALRRIQHDGLDGARQGRGHQLR